MSGLVSEIGELKAGFTMVISGSDYIGGIQSALITWEQGNKLKSKFEFERQKQFQQTVRATLKFIFSLTGLFKTNHKHKFTSEHKRITCFFKGEQFFIFVRRLKIKSC